MAYFKIAADTAVVLADRFVIAAANTLTSTLDDRDAVALMAKAILQLEQANAVRAKVEAIGASAAPAQAAYEAHAPALAPESPIVLVGSADAPVNHLLYIQ